MRFKIGKIPRSKEIFFVNKDKEGKIHKILKNILIRVFSFDFASMEELLREIMHTRLKNIDTQIRKVMGSRKSEQGYYCRAIYPSTRCMRGIIQRSFEQDAITDPLPNLTKAENIINLIISLCFDELLLKSAEKEQIGVIGESKEISYMISEIIRNMLLSYFRAYKKMPDRFEGCGAVTAEYEVYHSLPIFITGREGFDLLNMVN